MNLGELFRSEVVTVSPDDSIAAAVREMEQNNVGAVVVVRGKAVVGILTDRDAALALAVKGVAPNRAGERSDDHRGAYHLGRSRHL